MRLEGAFAPCRDCTRPRIRSIAPRLSFSTTGLLLVVTIIFTMLSRIAAFRVFGAAIHNNRAGVSTAYRSIVLAARTGNDNLNNNAIGKPLRSEYGTSTQLSSDDYESSNYLTKRAFSRTVRAFNKRKPAPTRRMKVLDNLFHSEDDGRDSKPTNVDNMLSELRSISSQAKAVRNSKNEDNIQHEIRPKQVDDRKIDISSPHLWYPAAREMKRKIVCHVGPTNSGSVIYLSRDVPARVISCSYLQGRHIRHFSVSLKLVQARIVVHYGCWRGKYQRSFG
jgi:hypothetical protein